MKAFQFFMKIMSTLHSDLTADAQDCVANMCQINWEPVEGVDSDWYQGVLRQAEKTGISLELLNEFIDHTSPSAQVHPYFWLRNAQRQMKLVDLHPRVMKCIDDFHTNMSVEGAIDWSEAENLFDVCKEISSLSYAKMEVFSEIVDYGNEHQDWDSGIVSDWPEAIIYGFYVHLGVDPDGILSHA